MTQPVLLRQWVDPHVVGLLEEILEQAKSGDVSAIAVSIIRPNGCVGYRFRWQSGQVGSLELLGAIELLKSKLVARHFEDQE